MAKRYSPCMSCIPRRKLSMLPAPGRRMRRSRRSRNWTSFSSPWARAWDGHEVVDLAVGRLVLHYAEENSDEVVAALDDETEAVIRELEAHHKEARRSLRRRRDRARGPPTLPREYQDLVSTCRYVTRSAATDPQQDGPERAGGGADEQGEAHLLWVCGHAEDVVETADERRPEAVGRQVHDREEDADGEAAAMWAGDVMDIRRREPDPHDGQAVEDDVQEQQSEHLVREEEGQPERHGDEGRSGAEGHAVAGAAASCGVGEVAAGDRQRHADHDREKAADRPDHQDAHVVDAHEEGRHPDTEVVRREGEERIAGVEQQQGR